MGLGPSMQLALKSIPTKLVISIVNTSNFVVHDVEKRGLLS